jgi:hypothetical protein
MKNVVNAPTVRFVEISVCIEKSEIIVEIIAKIFPKIKIELATSKLPSIFLRFFFGA